MRRTLSLLALARARPGRAAARRRPAGRPDRPGAGRRPDDARPAATIEETPAYNVLLNIYDTLLFRDKDLKIIPWLAESWRVVNPTTWEFKIRKGVKFHNGEEVDAEAVKFSLERLIESRPEDAAGPELHPARPGRRASDKHTVRVITEEALRRPSRTSSRSEGAIVPPKYFKEKDGGLPGSKSRSGRDPYKFVRVGEGRGHHAGGQRVLVGRGAEDQDARLPADPRAHDRVVAALQAGEVDVVTNVPPHLVKQVECRLRSSTSPRPRASATIFLWIYTHKYDKDHKLVGPLSTVRPRTSGVRQALNYAVNVDEIIKNVLEGNGIRIGDRAHAASTSASIPASSRIKQDVGRRPAAA